MKTLDDLALKENEKQAIREATRMLEDRFPVKEVILFGSKARGDDDPESPSLPQAKNGKAVFLPGFPFTGRS